MVYLEFYVWNDVFIFDQSKYNVEYKSNIWDKCEIILQNKKICQEKNYIASILNVAVSSIPL